MDSFSLSRCLLLSLSTESRSAGEIGVLEGGDWARIGVELFPHNNVDATELYTCHGGGAQGAALVRERLGTPEHADEGPLVVVEAALADAQIPLRGFALGKGCTFALPVPNMAEIAALLERAGAAEYPSVGTLRARQATRKLQAACPERHSGTHLR
mgnify:CR=1 FL=1